MQHNSRKVAAYAVAVVWICPSFQQQRYHAMMNVLKGGNKQGRFVHLLKKIKGRIEVKYIGSCERLPTPSMNITLSTAIMSAPWSSRSIAMASYPPVAARCRDVCPSCTRIRGIDVCDVREPQNSMDFNLVNSVCISPSIHEYLSRLCVTPFTSKG